MGRLGLELNRSTWLSNPNKEPAKEISLRDIEFVAEEEVIEDSAVDSVIAYVSYYIMVFVAFCAFMPAETAYAVGYTKHTIYKTVSEKIGKKISAEQSGKLNLKIDWDLRQSKP